MAEICQRLIPGRLADLYNVYLCSVGLKEQYAPDSSLAVSLLQRSEGETPANWSSNYPPCNRHSELLKRDTWISACEWLPRIHLSPNSFGAPWIPGPGFSTWTGTRTTLENCSIQLVDGERELFQSTTIAARSQLPDRLDFQGWIAFNPAQTLSETELYRISVHEIGHILGLHHSSNAMSVMYGFDLEGLEWLDPTDLAALATHHKLRIAALDKPVKLTQGR